MSSFRTEIFPVKAPFEVNYSDCLMLIGSCFADNMGDRFADARFDVCSNPFGVLYNPISVADALEAIHTARHYTANELVFDGNLWHSPFHHGRFSSPLQPTVLDQINTATQLAHRKLRSARFLFITLGTAWVFEDLQTKNIVANCHKLPENRFRRFRLSVGEIVERYGHLIAQISQVNPDLNIVFTISPVRHWKDTAHGNNVSKSVLLLAVDELAQTFSNVFYFPAYELVLDDLRDYRFYANDMLHPSEQAVDYIWEKLKAYCFGSDALEFCKQTLVISSAMQHRPIHAHGQPYSRFLETLAHKIETTSRNFPLADLSREKEWVTTKKMELEHAKKQIFDTDS